MKKGKADAEALLDEERRLRAEDTKRLQDKLDEDSARANSLDKQLEELKPKPTQWLRELQWIDSKMSSKLFFPLYPLQLRFYLSRD